MGLMQSKDVDWEVCGRCGTACHEIFRAPVVLTVSAHVDVPQVVARVEDHPWHIKPSGSHFCKIRACTRTGCMLHLEFFIRQMEGKFSGVLACFREDLLRNWFSMRY